MLTKLQPGNAAGLADRADLSTQPCLRSALTLGTEERTQCLAFMQSHGTALGCLHGSALSFCIG